MKLFSLRESIFIIYSLILGVFLGFFINSGFKEALTLLIQVLIAYGSIIALIYTIKIKLISGEILRLESEIHDFYNMNKVEVIKKLGDVKLLEKFKEEEGSEFRPLGVELKSKDIYLTNFVHQLSKIIENKFHKENQKIKDSIWEIIELRNKARRVESNKDMIDLQYQELHTIDSHYLNKIYLIWIMIPINLFLIIFLHSFDNLLLLRIAIFSTIIYSIMLIFRTFPLIRILVGGISRDSLKRWLKEFKKEMMEESKYLSNDSKTHMEDGRDS